MNKKNSYSSTVSSNTRKPIKERPSPGLAVSERRGSACPAQVALSQLASPVEGSCNFMYDLESFCSAKQAAAPVWAIPQQS